MKKWICLLAMMCCPSLCRAAPDRQDAVNRLDRAAKVMHEIMDASDKRIPDRIMRRARCIAVVPHLIKGGFVFGAEEGKGVATCRTRTGWSAPAFIEMGGGSWGTQIGAEAVDLVMVIKGTRGMQKLLSSKFEIGRDASVAVGPLGRHSSENTDVKFQRADPDLLARSRRFSGDDLRRRSGPRRQQLPARALRAKGYDAGLAARASATAACRKLIPFRSERGKSPGSPPDCEASETPAA